MKRRSPLLALALALLAAAPGRLGAQKPDFLSEDEQDKLREAAQEPSERIRLYLTFAQARLERFENFRMRPSDPKEDQGAYLDSLLGEYISLNEELKSWIDYQYEHNADMRRGLRALLEQGPRQLESLRRIEQSPDRNATAYSQALREAIGDLGDTLDGATKALAEQEKKFAAAKREEKVAARVAKERQKEEQRRSKEEKKLRKRQHNRGVPGEPDEH